MYMALRIRATSGPKAPKLGGRLPGPDTNHVLKCHGVDTRIGISLAQRGASSPITERVHGNLNEAALPAALLV